MTSNITINGFTFNNEFIEKMPKLKQLIKPESDASDSVYTLDYKASEGGKLTPEILGMLSKYCMDSDGFVVQGDNADTIIQDFEQITGYYGFDDIKTEKELIIAYKIQKEKAHIANKFVRRISDVLMSYNRDNEGIKNYKNEKEKEELFRHFVQKFVTEISDSLITYKKDEVDLELRADEERDLELRADQGRAFADQRRKALEQEKPEILGENRNKKRKLAEAQEIIELAGDESI